jgi:hypothetical protein
VGQVFCINGDDRKLSEFSLDGEGMLMVRIAIR